MKALKATVLTPVFLFLCITTAHATAITVTGLSGANSWDITTTPPDPVVKDPNDGVLLIWDEVQNSTLTTDLQVDRVADPGASFVIPDGGGYKIIAGTIVSSHYVQWDPESGNSSTVIGTLHFDSDIFAFITADQKMFDTDEILGLPGLNYNDFLYRGLEPGDSTSIDGHQVVINWTASSPGDWTRLITAYSPAAAVPIPTSILLLGSGLLGLLRFRRKFRKD